MKFDVIKKIQKLWIATTDAFRNWWKSGGRSHFSGKPVLKNVFTSDIGELARKCFSQFKDYDGARDQLKNIQSWPTLFRLLMLVAVFISVFSLISTQLWRAPLNELHRYSDEVTLQKARYMRVGFEVGLLEQRLERMGVIDSGLGQMLEMIPAELEIVHVLDQVTTVARESGMQLQSFKPEAEIDEEAYVALPINVRLTGSFDSVGRFLESVSRLKHLVTIDVVLESSQTAMGKLNLDARLRAYRGEPTRSTAQSDLSARKTNADR